jgi:hypothetical protein
MDKGEPWQQGLVAGLTWLVVWVGVGTLLGSDLLTELIEGTFSGAAFALVYTYMQSRGQEQ